jgi:uncharacterized membrane protein YraQ (UPF0718 family)/copper chaperone CopZ
MLLAMWHVILELAPWLLLGALVAGVLHIALPPNFIRTQLTGSLGVVKAVLLGVPLPLCSCGVIPTGLGLKKDGASDGATVGFLISTPQTGVDSILVSASFLGLPFAIFKVASAAVTGLVGGFATNAMTHEAPPSETSEACAIESLPKRGLRAMIDHSLELIQMIWRWLVFGIVVSALITVLVPSDAFAGLSAYGGLAAMAATLLISIPMYVCATASVPIAAALVASGLPTGAALVFLMAGPATNVATIGAVYRTLGKRALAVYLSTIILGSIGFGLMFDSLLDTTAKAAVHDHHGATWWATGSAVVLLALLAWFAFQDGAQMINKLFGSKSPSSAQTIEVDVQGMTCNGCVSRLHKVLTREDGVDSADITLEPGHATIRGKVTEARIRELIEQAGFTAA